MNAALTIKPELLPYTVIWHQKGEKPYALERYKTTEEVNNRLDWLWRHDHREAVGTVSSRTDFAMALVWRFIERDRDGRRRRIEEIKEASG